MYNKDLLSELISKHGIDEIIRFCEIESELNDLKAADIQFNQINEYQFERNWWKNAAQQLKEIKNGKRSIEEISQGF